MSSNNNKIINLMIILIYLGLIVIGFYDIVDQELKHNDQVVDMVGNTILNLTLNVTD